MAKKQAVLNTKKELKEEGNVVLTDFANVKNIFMGHMDAYYPYALKLYKNYYMYPVDRYEELCKSKEQWRTNIKSPLTHQFTNAVYNMLIQASIEFFVIDKKGKNNKLAEEMLSLAEFIKDKDEYSGQRESVAFDDVLLGTGVASTTFVDYKIESEWMRKDGTIEKILDVSQYPMMTYKSPFNFMYYGSQTHTDKRYSIDRKLPALNALRGMYPELTISDAKLKEISMANNYISQFDFEAIKAYMPYYSHSAQLGVGFGGGSSGPWISNGYQTSGFRNILSDDTFDIKKAKQIEVIEAATFYYKTIYANGVLLGTIPTKGPYKRGEYSTCSFKSSPGLFTGIGIGHVVAPIQDAFDAILNSRIDNVKLAVNNMYMMDSSMTLFNNSPTFTTKPGGVLKVSNMDGLKPIPIQEVKNSAYEETNAMFGMVQGAVAIASPMLGIQQKVERVAAGPEMLKQAADNQLAPLLRNMEKFMANVFKRMVILAKCYMSESELEKILGKDNEFSKVDLGTIMGDYDYTFFISSPQLDLNQARRMQMLELLKFAQDGKQNGSPTNLDTEKLTAAIIDSYSLPKDLTLSDEQVREMMGNTDKMQGAIEKATGNSSAPSMEALMRKGQGQGAAVPPEMTTNAGGANQFSEGVNPPTPQQLITP